MWPSLVQRGPFPSNLCLRFSHGLLQLTDHLENDTALLGGAVVDEVFEVCVVLRSEDGHVVVHKGVYGGVQCVCNGGNGDEGQFGVVVFNVADVGDSQVCFSGEFFLTR